MLAAISSTQATRRDIVNSEIISSKTSQNTVVDHHSPEQRDVHEHSTHDGIEFERRNDLIYHLNRFTYKARLCILKSLIKEMFVMTHDEMFHAEFHRVYAAIFETLYIRRLTHHLRQYIAYCPNCLLNQIKRHKSYEALNSISSSKISFHIIVMNFILTLSRSDRFDTILTVTDKFSKEKILVSGENT